MFKVNGFRMKSHLMPVRGWLNDPNGLIEYKGIYHIFYQATPDLNSQVKCWGHYTTKDFKHYIHHGYPIMPDTEYESHGSYSGSATIYNDKMVILYTGNSKIDGDYDYINEGRLSSVIKIESTDGINFINKKIILKNDDYPSDYSCHVRDPEIYYENNKYTVILGGRTKDSKAAIIIYETVDLENYKLVKDLRFDDLGYMLECPIYFKINNQVVYGFSPQGVKPEGDRFNNIFSSGYCINEISKKNYIEWDKGYDFYAPKVFKDSKNREILIGWAGIADEKLEYTYDVTLSEGWIHSLTLPREISYKNNKLYTYPIEEILSLAKKYEKKNYTTLDSFIAKINVCEEFKICLNEILDLCYNNNRIIVSFKSNSYGRKRREFIIDDLKDILIYNDVSIVEIYFNKGEYVFTTRCFSECYGLNLIEGKLDIEISELEEFTYEETCSNR